jgi:hypothetical protein
LPSQLTIAQRWNFPGKQNPAHKNPTLIARIKELWEKNYTQKDMLDALQVEGFQINDRELMRVRLRFKWFLRESRSKGPQKKKTKKPKKVVLAGNTLIDQLASAILQREDSSSENEEDDEEDVAGEPVTQIPHPPIQPLDEEEALRRRLRQEQLQAESDEKWRTKKRRRRTRGWAGLPADAPGEPPRFPSETTIDESKAYLRLDNKLYQQMREQFQAICEGQSVSKKTIAGPEKWNELLQRLVRENAHLANVLQQEAESLQHSNTTWRPKDYKILSLDVICQDVTKRMRTMNSRMGMPEAKNVLGLNPEQTRQVRSTFLAILKSDNITNKLELGDERWTQLKQRWVQESELLSRLIAPEEVPVGSEAGPKHSQTIRAVEMLARDVMKRLQAELAQHDASWKKQSHQGPGPGPAPPSLASHTASSHTRQRGRRTPSNNNSMLQGPSSAAAFVDNGFQIDPSLLLAASDAAFVSHDATPSHHFSRPAHQDQSRIHHLFTETNTQQHDPSQYSLSLQMRSSSFLHTSSAPLPIYFRLHPHSTTPLPNKTVWLSVLQSGTVAEIKDLATREHPGTTVLRLEGQLSHRTEGMEREVMVSIDDDAELGAFLGHVQGGKATFVVMLAVNHDTSTYS